MPFANFNKWLLVEKNITIRSAKDVISRYKRAEKIVGSKYEEGIPLSLLLKNQEYINCSICVKSQLKRAVNLYTEFLEKEKSKECENGNHEKV